VIPFVTEELWRFLDDSGRLLAAGPYPRAQDELIDLEAEVALERLIEAVTLVRGWRDSVGARPGLLVPARLVAQGYELTAPALARMARLKLAETGGDGAHPNGHRPVASVAVPGGVVEILSGDELDLAAAERRRVATRERLTLEINRVQDKLARPGFLEKAPANVVQGERERLERLRAELEAL